MAFQLALLVTWLVSRVCIRGRGICIQGRGAASGEADLYLGGRVLHPETGSTSRGGGSASEWLVGQPSSFERYMGYGQQAGGTHPTRMPSCEF